MEGPIQSWLHLLVATLQAGLTVWAVRVYLRSRRWQTLIVVAVLGGLTYDNLVLGSGRFIGHGDFLEALSYPRFYLHAFTTPLLILTGHGALKAARHAWARTSSIRFAVWTITLLMVGWGVVTDVVRLELTPQTDAGVASYSNAGMTVPVPAIVTILVLIAFGMVLWVRPGWKWLAVGSLAMLVASAVMLSGLIVNLGELALLVGLVATEAKAGGWARAGGT